MDRKGHRARHLELHMALDELIADWALHNSGQLTRRGTPKVYSNTTIAELMEWSHKQTIEPDELEGQHEDRTG